MSGFVAAVVIGAIVGALTLPDGRLRIADEPPLAVLVCASGAIAGWAFVQTFGVAGDTLGAAAIVGPLVGAIVIAVLAWRGRRRTFSELGLHPHSD